MATGMGGAAGRSAAQAQLLRVLALTVASMFAAQLVVGTLHTTDSGQTAATQFHVQFNDPEVSSGFHGERSVDYSSVEVVSPPIADEPTLNPDGYYHHAVYDRCRSGSILEPTSSSWVVKFRTCYPSVAVSASDPDGDGVGGLDYEAVSGRVTLLLLHYYWYGKEYLDADPMFSNGAPVNVWLNEWGPSGGGGEQNGNNLYINNVDVWANVWTATAWIRLLAHEYGHQAIPATGRYAKYEPYSNGYLGERLFVKWMTWNVERYNLDSQAGEWNSQGEVWDGGGTHYWDEYSAATGPFYSSLDETQVIQSFLNAGPTSSLIGNTGTEGFDYYTGLALYIDSSQGASTLKAVFRGMSGSSPANFMTSYQSVLASHTSTVVQAEDFVPGTSNVASQYTSDTFRNSPTYRKEISIETGNVVHYWIYCASALCGWSLSLLAKAGGQDVQLEVRVDGGVPRTATVSTAYFSSVNTDIGLTFLGWHDASVRYQAGTTGATVDHLTMSGHSPGVKDLLMWIGVFSPAELNVYSPGGAHTGHNRASQRIERYIPDSGYWFVDSEEQVELVNAEAGRYYLELFGKTTGSFTLRVRAFSGSQPSVIESITGFILAGETVVVYVTLHSDSGGIQTSLEQGRISPDLPQLAAGICAPETGHEGLPVRLDGSCSQVPGSGSVAYEWDFNNDGTTDATGIVTENIWFDNIAETVHLTVTSTDTVQFTDEFGNSRTETVVRKSTSAAIVTILNRDPEIEDGFFPGECPSTRIGGFLLLDFSLRVAGEKWHDVTAYLLADGTPISVLHVFRTPGSPNEQMATDTAVCIDISRVHTVRAEFNPWDDPVNGQVPGSTPVWLIFAFANGEEKLHHNFNVEQSTIRNSTHWVHVEPWVLDLSPLFIGRDWTFLQTTTDPGTDDLCLKWAWGDGTTTEKVYPWPPGAPVCGADGGSTPYDMGKNSYPATTQESFVHRYSFEGNFVVNLTVTDDEKGPPPVWEVQGFDSDSITVAAIHLPHVAPTR